LKCFSVNLLYNSLVKEWAFEESEVGYFINIIQEVMCYGFNVQHAG